MELPALRRYIQENETSIKDAIGENKLLEWLLFIDDRESELAKMAEEKNETAINFYKMGLTLDQIAQGTGIDKEKLKEILKDVER
jgi:hypothetical protein